MNNVSKNNQKEINNKTLPPELIEALIADSILIVRDVVVELYQGFEKVMMFAGGLLYNVAKKAGKLMAKKLIEKGYLNKQNYLDILVESLVRSNYATKVEIKEIEGTPENPKKIVFELHGTLLGARIGKRKKPVDQPIAGFIAGWIEEVTGRKTNAKETQCIAQGHKTCQIEVKLK